MRLHYSSMCFPVICRLLIMLVLTDVSLNLFIHLGEAKYDFSTISFNPKITAKSDGHNIITSHRILDEVHLDNLKKTVHDLSSFHNRHTESQFIDDVSYWLTEKLQNICATDVYVQNFTYTPDKTKDDDNEVNGNNSSQRPISYNLKNIACEKPGSTNNTILISAHYDSRMEDINNSTARAPGADDNASGVSALLEVARILSKVNLNHSIMFVLFSGEEQGKWGSTYYADHIDETDVDLDLLINLDMIGFSSRGVNDFVIEYDNGNVVQDNDKFSQAVARFIKEKVASEYINLNTTLGILQNTDYLPFEELGYTVIGFHDNGVTTNPNHHKSTDTPDTLDYEYLTSVAKLTLTTILRLDELVMTSNLDAPSFLIRLK
jgi:hypothetical protein